MSKFDRAYQVFIENGANQSDRKQLIKSIAFVLGVTESNAGVYLYKCLKKFESQPVVADQVAVTNPVKVKEEPVSDTMKIKSSTSTKRIAVQKNTLLHNIENFSSIPFTKEMIPAFLIKSWAKSGI